MMMTRIATICLVFLLQNAFAAALGAPGAITVTVKEDRPVRAIPADFLGLSYETFALNRGVFATGNTKYVQLLKNLGPGVLRIGGNSTERAHWGPTKDQMDGCTVPRGADPIEINPADIDALVAFSREIGWKFLVSLNLGGCFRPKALAAQAKYVCEKAGSQLFALEIGNEPDLYAKQRENHGLRPASWGLSDLISEYTSYESQIRSVAPQIPLTGPETVKTADEPDGRWLPGFVAQKAGSLAVASYHYYPMHATSKTAKAPSVKKLLSSWPIQNFLDSIRVHLSATKEKNLPLRLTETNSVSGGGKEGVSDTFAAALWAVDYLFTNVAEGVAGINFHSGMKKSYYSPIRIDMPSSFTPLPLYYAMLFFHHAAQGSLVENTVMSGADDSFRAYAANDGSIIRVTLLNKDMEHDRKVEIRFARNYARASLLRLSAPSPLEKSNVTFGGAAVRSDGTWAAEDKKVFPITSGVLRVDLPKASAALVTLEK